MTLTQLRYIVAVARQRSFGAAAEECHITQPTLSMQVQKLEEFLGVEIFDRSTSPVRVTEFGKKIIDQARIVLDESDRISELVKTETNEVSGKLSLAVIPTLAPYLLPLFISDFTKKYPQVEIVVEELQTDQIITKLKNKSIDFGLLVTPLNDRELSEKVIFFEPLYVYTAKDNLLFTKKEIKQSDLSSSDVWLLSEGHCFRDQTLNLCKERVHRKNNSLRFESGNFETLKRMVDQSGGYTLLPHLAVDEIVHREQKKQLKAFAAPIPAREVSLVCSKQMRRIGMLNALMECIRSKVPAEILKKSEIQRVNIK